MRALVAALALSLAAVGCSGSGSDEPDGAPSTGETTSTGPAEVTELEGGPVGVADVAGEAWTVLVADGTVRTGDDTRIDVGDSPLRIVSTPGGVWVSVIGDGTVVRIDPATLQIDRTVRLRPAGSEPEGLAWDGESLWVVDQAGGRVVQLDADGQVVEWFSTGDEPRLVAAGDSGVWVADYGASSVTRVGGGRVTTAPVADCVGPQGVAEAAGRVWLACTQSGKAVALDARSLAPEVEIPDVPAADAVVAHGDTVYVVGQAGPTVYVIDADSGELTDTIVLGEAFPTNENVGAAVVGDDLVVTHPDEQKIYTLPLP